MPTVWPVTLPQYLSTDGYSESPPELSVRTQMDAGPAKVRRRFTAGVRPVSGSVLLTEAQIEILDAFYVTTLEGGSLTFDWLHPRTAASATFRFTAVPKYSTQGGDLWRADLALEIMP